VLLIGDGEIRARHRHDDAVALNLNTDLIHALSLQQKGRRTEADARQGAAVDLTCLRRLRYSRHQFFSDEPDGVLDTGALFGTVF
jgi:hypothetical protein